MEHGVLASRQMIQQSDNSHAAPIPLKRLLAFYLPQYHPIPENDAWWGRGFTEWRNVVRARPQFSGHYQPHLPADLGFYDLRVPDVRTAQAEMAEAAGIYGFCYYHYWFNGKRLLERPFSEVLESGAPDFPFCLCWANENWTRRWDGRDREILMAQSYNADDDVRHIRDLFPAFEDPRYIRVQNKPLFIVYKTADLPDSRATAERWREESRRAGIGDLYLLKIDNGFDEGTDPLGLGFDAAVEFQPAWLRIGTRVPPPFAHRLKRALDSSVSSFERHFVFDYPRVVENMLEATPPPYKRFPGVTPMWDNHARRAEGAYILHGSTPALYERWLSAVLDRFRPPSPEENFVFINAWNEWAEGNHLEPDRRWGRAYLDATRRAAQGRTQPARRLAASVAKAVS